MTEKDRAFELFDEGKTTGSPEVKALGLKSSTKYNDWQNLRGIILLHQRSLVMRGKGKPVSELEMVVPSEGKELGEGRAGEEMKGKIPRTVLENQNENRERTEN